MLRFDISTTDGKSIQDRNVQVLLVIGILLVKLASIALEFVQTGV